MNLRSIKLTSSFLAALFISSVCGTQYLFSAYSTSLAERLDFSSVEVNTIGSAANYGVYLCKPLFGYIADNYGGRRTTFFASFGIFLGYFCLAMTYNGNFSDSSFLLCALYVFIAGMASSAGLVSSLVTIAKNIQSFRGIAFGAPIALFGLSAAIYSEINTLWFKKDTYHFLLFIAISSGVCMFIGSWFLVVVPPPNNQDEIVVEEEGCSSHVTSKVNTVGKSDKSENTPLLNKVKEEVDIGGWDLFYNHDAKVLAMSMFFIAGTGLMYINNVGSIIKSLYFASSTHPHTTLPNSEDHSSSQIQELQNMHVFFLSVFSCIGRLSVGVISDLAGLLFNLPRLWFFIISGFWLFLAQLLILFYVNDLDKLLIVTILVGFGFGNLYAIGPTIVSEWFGTKRFGLNWGMIACIPAFGGQLFNLLFGFNNDQHQHHHCLGQNCYDSVFYISAFACLFSICISLRLLYTKKIENN
ncbi:major facilitator superfamily domain-containing protein [Rhizophagus diaphanus]|nr:major facilitator superfamily domain-containing protein [Rhizophagus diaphanus] [Rhizophagus sp. MUCL 43196]